MMRTHTGTRRASQRTVLMGGGTKSPSRKEKFLQCADAVTAAKIKLDIAMAIYRNELRRAQDAGFSLIPLKRALQDLRLDTATREANEKEETLYKKWLEEL